MKWRKDLQAVARAASRVAVTRRACALVAILLAAIVSGGAAAQERFQGQWLVEQREGEEKVQLTLRYREERPASDGKVHRSSWDNSFRVGREQLEGLTREQAFSPGGTNVRFRLRRDAGTFECEGWFKDGSGSGHFTFAPSAAFASELSRRGVGSPTDRQLFMLAQGDVSLALLDELAAQGYPQPTTESYVRTSLTGVDLALLRQLRANRTRFGTLEQLVDHWNNGEVGPATPPPPPHPADAVSRTVDRVVPVPGVEPAPPPPPAPSADAAPPGGAPAVPPTPAINGAPADVAPPPPPPAIGSPEVTPTSGTWRIRAVRGGGHYIDLFWDDDSNWSRPFSLGELTYAPENGSGVWVILRDAGRFEMNGSGDDRFASGDLLFVPNRSFVETLRELDLVPARGVRDHDLKNLTWGNVGAREVRAFRRQFDDLTLSDVVSFAIRGVTPEYVDEIRAAGVTARTPGEIVDLRHHDVTVADVRALRERDQRDLSTEAVLRAVRG